MEKSITFYLCDDDRKLLEKSSRASRLSLSAFCRQACIEKADENETKKVNVSGESAVNS